MNNLPIQNLRPPREETVFLTETLPSGSKATVYDATGYHFFLANLNAEREARQIAIDRKEPPVPHSNTLFLKHLILILVRIDGEPLTMGGLDGMFMADVNFLCEILIVQLKSSKDVKP